MKLWILSDLHADRGVGDIAVHAPEFDVFVCAGDVVSGDIAMSIEMVAALARGKPAVFVAGNHEWMSPIDAVLEYGRAAAAKHGIHWLELDTIDIGGVEIRPRDDVDAALDARYPRASAQGRKDARRECLRPVLWKLWDFSFNASMCRSRTYMSRGLARSSCHRG